MSITLLSGDCRDVLPTLAANSVHCVVTSPPYYGLRDYGTAQWDGGDAECQHLMPPNGVRDKGRDRAVSGGTFHDSPIPNQIPQQFRDTCGKCGARRVDRQIGLEPTPDEYLATMVAVFREVKRVLRPDGTLWLNVGDSYAGPHNGYSGDDRPSNAAGSLSRGSEGARQNGQRSRPGKPKDLLLMPARLALALQADGWWIRSDIIWAKPNPMPESVTDRPTSAYEHVFLLTKSARYFYDAEAVREEREPDSLRRSDLYGANPSFAKLNPDRNDGGRGGSMGFNGNPAGRNLRNVWTIATHAFSEWTPSHELVPVLASEGQAHVASKNAAGRDTARITSPDCPLHGGQPDSVPKGFYDGLSDDQVSRIRDTVGRHVPGTHPGSSTTQHTPVRSNSRPSRTSCSDPEGAASAMPHSTESHRTAHGPLSSAHAISSEETASDTPRTAQSPCSPASTDHGTAESRSEEQGSASSCELGTAADIARTSALGSSGACRCGYYRKVTTKTSHFATYPPELAERCIRAGTSERGCCAACGAPWRRETDKRFTTTRGQKEGGGAGLDATSRWAGWGNGVTDVTTTGWAASCACAADVVPATVLDVFAGAGTTLLVADRLQRNAMGIELNASYTTMAMERVRADAPLFADTPEPQPVPGFAQPDLFPDAERTEIPAPKLSVPAGWDTGPGAHGTIHRDGRTQRSDLFAEAAD